jgi:arginase
VFKTKQTKKAQKRSTDLIYFGLFIIPVFCVLYYNNIASMKPKEMAVTPIISNNTSTVNFCSVPSNIKIIEVPSELGAGTRGSSLGISALKTASLGFSSSLFACLPNKKIKTENKQLFSTVQNKYAKRLPSILTIWERVSASIQSSIQEGEFPVILSGDHSTAGGLISGMKMAYPDKRVGVIWVDAHADIHSPYTTPSGNVHGMPIAALLNKDHKEIQRNQIDEETSSTWEKLKGLGGIKQKIQKEDIVYLAVRDTEEEEDHIIRDNNIKKISVSYLREKGIETVVQEIYEYLKVDVIYISFDVDSMDPSLSSGTGTPVPGGITNLEAEDLLVSLVKNQKVKAFEITEINPTLDSENRMAKNAFKILEKVTDQIQKRSQ